MDMRPDAIHETCVKDVLDILSNGIDKIDLGKNNKTSVAFSGSLSKATSGLTAVFPVICSTSLSIESASMVAKAIEKNAVSMLQMAFAANNITNSNDGIEFLKSFHTNLDTEKITVDRFIDTMDGITGQNSRIIENAIPMPRVDESLIRAVKEDARKNLSFYLPDDISESSLNDFKIVKIHGNEMVIKEEEFNNPTSKTLKDSFDMKKNMIMPSDVKKANEAVPTMVVVNFIVDHGSRGIIAQQAVFGVKAKIYTVDAGETINKIITKNADGNLLLKFIKATTRETSFVKDFLLAIDDAKLDVLSRSKRGSSSQLFKVLERRSLRGKIRKLMKKENDAKAISSLIISKEDQEQLMKYNNIDVLDPKVIIPIMEKLNIMCFGIVDESNETVNLIYDGSSEYDVLTFSNLEREATDGSYKKIINLMTKMNN